MRSRVLFITGLVFSVLVGGSSWGSGVATKEEIPFPEISRMTKEQLKPLLGKPDVVIIDARPVEQWKYSDQMIPGSVHEDPMSVRSWAHKYDKDKKIVVY